MKQLQLLVVFTAILNLGQVAQAMPEVIVHRINQTQCSKQLTICQNNLALATEGLNTCQSDLTTLQSAYDQISSDLTATQAALDTLQGFYTTNLAEAASCAASLQIANDKGSATSAELNALKDQGSKSFFSLSGCFKSIKNRVKRGLPTGKLIKKCNQANQSNMDLAAALQGLGVQISIQTKVK